MTIAATCANCLCFAKPERSAKQAEQAQARGVDLGTGQCRRFPEPVQKHEAEWCFEHKRKNGAK